MKVRFAGFAPDVDQATKGIFTDCDQIIPTVKGFKSAPAPVSTTLPAASAAVTGAALIKKLDNSIRLFLGSSAKIEEATSLTALTDRSAAGGYTGTNAWRFAQFGDVTMAANKAQIIQSSTTGSFATVVGSPQAAGLETVGQFVFAFDTIDGTYGTRPDAWWCSALSDYTSWTPSIATQSATGRLTSAPGPITAAKRIGDGLVLYKERAMYLGSYVGPPAIWTFQELPGPVGCSSHEAVVSIGTAHYFPGYDDFYVFDGARAVSLNAPVKNWFYADASKANLSSIKGLLDIEKSLIYWFYPQEGSSSITRGIVYNYKTNQWAPAHRTLETVVYHDSAAITYDDLGSLYSTYANLPNIPYDSFYQAGRPTPAIVNTSHVVQTLTGTTDTSYITTGDYGDESVFVTPSRVRPRFAQSPTSSTLVNYYREDLGDSLTTDYTSTLTDGKYDFMRSSKWHRFRFNMVGNHEIYGMDITTVEDGDE
jgi:hypothetical protein